MRSLARRATAEVIGTGLLLGSASAIGLAGPAVILSYLLAAFINITVALALGELACAHPAAGSFGIYGDLYLNQWAGFLSRSGYWAAIAFSVRPHDQAGDERHAGEERQRHGTEDAVDAVPADRAQPVQQAGYDDRLAERKSGRRHLGEAELRAHRAQESNEERPDEVTDDDREQTGDEPELQEVERHQCADEERGRLSVSLPDGP